MKQSRKLVLRSRHVTELGSDELAAVAGGTHVGCPITHAAACAVSNPVAECLPVVYSLPNLSCLFMTCSGC